MNTIQDITNQFQIPGQWIEGKPYGAGHINQTYLVSFQDEQKTIRYLLQKISNKIFPDIGLMMDNIERVLVKLKEHGYGFDLIKTVSQETYYKAENGDCFRMYSLVEHAVSYETIQSKKHAYECGKMAAEFQQALAQFSFDPAYADMTKDFHNTMAYYKRLEQAINADCCNRVNEVQDEIAFYRERKHQMELLLMQAKQAKIPYRATHNDMRVSNFMMDIDTGDAVALIDLDTVIPGLAAYDYGDGIRSAAKQVTRKDGIITSVTFDKEVAEAFTKGYVIKAKEFLTKNELSSLADGILVMSLECGMRYLTDYLQGDVYFAKNKNGENKQNARREMLFVTEAEKHIEKIRAYIAQLEVQ
ncbi:MAG: phosphotransferase [bacterium]|nr:phosphotransferase [bacterium]